MPSCSVHHCVLFLLTLTFTTVPATEIPMYVTLHQPVTLPCEVHCSPKLAQWTLTSTRDVVFAQCNETSCRSLKDGYEMSHDGYLEGDLSLTITKPDYSMRETYTCECDYSDYVTVRLRISTVSSAVQVTTGEDLKLDLSVPEPVEVIYRGSVLAAGEQICTVTNRSLQCKAEYTPRTSLSYPELTLRHLGRSEGGTYTIRNVDYEEEIRVYAVSVSGLTTGETAGIVIVVLLLLVAVLIAGVMMYKKKLAADQKRRKVKRQKEEVDAIIQQYKSKRPGEESEKLQQVEDEIEALEKKYKGDNEHSDSIRDFCKIKRDELVMKQKEEVDKLFKEDESKPPGEEKEELQQQMKEKIDALWLKYSDDSEYKGDIRFFCWTYRKELVKRQKEEVDAIIQQYKSKPPGEESEKLLQQVEEKIEALEKKYEGDSDHSDSIRDFCKIKRDELVKRQKEEVDDLFKQAESKPPGRERMKLQQQVEEKIEALEKKYGDDREYKGDITVFCCTYREELVKSLKEEVEDFILKAQSKPPGKEKDELLQQVKKKIAALEENNSNILFCRAKEIELRLREQGDLLDFGRMFMTRTEVVVTILQELEGEATKRSISDKQLSEKCESVESNLKKIEIRCSEQREKMKQFVKEIKKQKPSGDVTDTEMIHNKETRVIEVKEEDKKPAGETDPLLHQV